jgi:uncharacterized membrane protein
MIPTWTHPLAQAATVGTALVAGTFFAFSNLVMRALASLPKEQGVAAMRGINVTVLNPLFLGLFIGTAILCLVLGIAAVSRLGEPAARFLLAGSLLYFVGTFGVTMALNVPLNDALAADANTWGRYVKDWTLWNHVRTAAAFLAALAFLRSVQ